MVQKFFKRFEIKYQISNDDRERLTRYLKGFMKPDLHSQNNFDYEVRSLYFDSLQRKAFYEKVDGIKYRKKLRIRYYPQISEENRQIFIEIKRKTNENVSKARIQVPVDDVIDIINDNTAIASNTYDNSSFYDKNTLEEIWYLKKRFNLKPVCAISYKRQALCGIAENNFRVTFDTNLRVSKHNFDLLNFHKGSSKLIIPRNRCVMEVKFNNIIPKWAINIIQTNNCIQNKISKFTTGLKRASAFSEI